jgi:RecA/RadA recombinase
MAQTLHQLAYEHDIAVVVINHVTTKFDKPSSTSSDAAGVGGLETLLSIFKHRSSRLNDLMWIALLPFLDSGNAVLRRLAPALGDLWSHSVTSRVMMYWHSAGASEGDPQPQPQTQTQQRRASLVKSPMMPPAHALFRVFEKGIRDVDEVGMLLRIVLVNLHIHS